MKYWILNIICAIAAIAAGMELYKESASKEDNLLKMLFLAAITLVSVVMYFITRKKRNQIFRDRINNNK